MDTKGFGDMGVRTEGFAACDYVYAEASGHYLAARTALSLLAVPGRVQSTLQDSAITQRGFAGVH